MRIPANSLSEDKVSIDT